MGQGTIFVLIASIRIQFAANRKQPDVAVEESRVGVQVKVGDSRSNCFRVM